MTGTAEQPADAPPAEAPADAPPRERWRAALVVPAVVAGPWVLLTAGAGLPAPVPTAAGAVLLLLLATTTATDLTRRRIPNWATYTAVLWALALHVVAAVLPADRVVRVPGPFAAEVPAASLLVGTTAGEAAGGFAVGFVVMVLLYGVFRGGAGDVKLVAAIGALVGGPDRVLSTIAYGYILAGVLAACFLVWEVGPLGLLREVGYALGLTRRPPGTDPLGLMKVPMAPFLNAGALLAVFWRTV